MNKSFRHIKIMLFDCSCSPRNQDLENLYRFWLRTWSETYRELKDDFEEVSDHFCRQQIQLGIYHRSEPIAFSGISFFDLKSKIHLDHSYMKHYPLGVIQSWMEREISQIMSISHLCISPHWRGANKDIKISELLMASSLKVFTESSAQIAIGYTRNDRGVNKLSYAYGADCEREGLDAHNVKVDVVSFQKEKLIIHLGEYAPDYFQFFWRSRSDFRQDQIPANAARGA